MLYNLNSICKFIIVSLPTPNPLVTAAWSTSKAKHSLVVLGAHSMSQKEKKILQITPALSGWSALYAKPDEPKEGEPGYYTQTVICWALVEGNRIVPIVEGIEGLELEPAYPGDDFLGYSYPGCTDDWSKLAQQYRKRMNRGSWLSHTDASSI